MATSLRMPRIFFFFFAVVGTLSDASDLDTLMARTARGLSERGNSFEISVTLGARPSRGP